MQKYIEHFPSKSSLQYWKDPLSRKRKGKKKGIRKNFTSAQGLVAISLYFGPRFYVELEAAP